MKILSENDPTLKQKNALKNLENQLKRFNDKKWKNIRVNSIQSKKILVKNVVLKSHILSDLFIFSLILFLDYLSNVHLFTALEFFEHSPHYTIYTYSCYVDNLNSLSIQINIDNE